MARAIKSWLPLAVLLVMTSASGSGITLIEKFTTVEHLCKVLTKETGRAHTVSPMLSKRKLTVACSDSSAEEFRTAVAHFLGAQWIRQGDGLLLAISPDSKKRELQKDEKTKREIADWQNDTLRFLAWCAFQNPDSLKLLVNGKEVYWGPPNSLSQEDIRSLAAKSQLHQPVAYLLRSQPKSSLPLNLSEAIIAPVSVDGKRQWLLVRSTAVGDLILSTLMPFGDKDEELLSTKIPLQRWTKRQTSSEVDRSLPEAIGARDPRNEFVPGAIKDPGYFGRALSLSEHAVFLHDSYQVPVIADAFRVAVTPLDFDGSGKLKVYLRKLEFESERLPFSKIESARYNSGWIELRHQEADALRVSEVEEAKLAKLESLALAGKEITLNHYADLASTISPAQAPFFDRPNLLLKFSSLPLRKHLPHLKFWGALGPSQREASVAAGLSFAELSVQQQLLLRQAFYASLESAVIDRSPIEAILEGRDTALSVRVRISRTTSPISNTELIQSGAIEQNQIIGEGSLVQFRFDVENKTALLTAFRINPKPGGSK